jgi:hypothetical protein
MDEETVLREAYGGYASTSASFLIYIDKAMSANFVQQDSQSEMVPGPLKVSIQ